MLAQTLPHPPVDDPCRVGLFGVSLLIRGSVRGRDTRPNATLRHEAKKDCQGRFRASSSSADTEPHGARGNHEFVTRRCMSRAPSMPSIGGPMRTLYKQKWPKDLKNADASWSANHLGSAVNPAVKEATDRGAGSCSELWCGCEQGAAGPAISEMAGGYSSRSGSVNPQWTPNFKEIAKHETTRGVKLSRSTDEWYYTCVSQGHDRALTPVLSHCRLLNKIAGKRAHPLRRSRRRSTCSQETQNEKAGKSTRESNWLRHCRAGPDPAETPMARNPDGYADGAAGRPSNRLGLRTAGQGAGLWLPGLHKHENWRKRQNAHAVLTRGRWVAKLAGAEGRSAIEDADASDDLEKNHCDGKSRSRSAGLRFF